MNETWKKLHAAAKGRLNEILKAGGDEALRVIQEAFGPDATFETYTDFHRRWAVAKEEGEKLAELIVVYGVGVLQLEPRVCEALRLAIPYARGCLAAIAAECTSATNGRSMPTIETFRALTNRDDAAATRLSHQHLTRLAANAP